MFDDIVLSLLGTVIRMSLELGFLLFILSLARDLRNTWSTHE